MAEFFPSTPNASLPDQQSWKESYERVLPEMLALAAKDLVRPGVRVVPATAKAFGALPRLAPLRSAIADRVPEALAPLDRLEDYIGAAAYAHTEHVSAAASSDEFRAVFDRVRATRDLFAVDASAFVARGFIGAETLRGLRGTRGYENQLSDLGLFVQVFRRNWSALAGKCPITTSDLEDAENLVALAHRALGERENVPGNSFVTADLRVRAFTLFVRAYERVRRAVVYLRAEEGDADSIMKSLYAGRGRRKTNGRVEAPAATAPVSTETTPATPVVAPSVVAPAATPVANENAASSSSSATKDAAPVSTVAPTTETPEVKKAG